MKSERNSLKDTLEEVAENEYQVPQNANPFELALTMMNYIGDLDGYLRDELIYTVFAKWILADVFDKDELYQILMISLDDNHLFYKIGNVDDSVFTRTFSVLLVPLILYVHRRSNFLSIEDLTLVKEKLICYLTDEKDVRGYVNHRGWAHGVAHAADALDELVKCSSILDDDLKAILQVIYQKATINYYAYINDEDERMVTAIVSILERDQLPDSDIINWLQGFANIPKTDRLPDDRIVWNNTKNFLRSLYFRLLEREEYVQYIHSIKTILDTMKKN